MRSILPLDEDDVSIYTNIVNSKHNPTKMRLEEVQPQVMAAYGNYRILTPDLGELETIVVDQHHKDALIHAFEKRTKPISKLRSRLLDRISNNYCPYCGISESSTLDHYMPKEDYSEFAVFSENLVPCCSCCNTKKQQQFVDEANQSRLFIHPYFDNIPEQHFLSLDVIVKPDSISLTYLVTCPPAMEPDEFQLIENHFDKLMLAKRFRLRSLATLKQQFKWLERYFAKGNLSEKLKEQAEEIELDNGLNHWKAVLFNALSESQEFCEGGFNVISNMD